MSCLIQLRIWNIQPLRMFLQLKDLLVLSKITHKEKPNQHCSNGRPEISGRKNEVFKLWKTRTEEARSDFISEIADSSIDWTSKIDFRNPQGLKNRLLKLMWEFANKQTQTQACELGSSPVTAPFAATIGHHFKMMSGALSPTAITAIPQHQQQQQQDVSI